MPYQNHPSGTPIDESVLEFVKRVNAGRQGYDNFFHILKEMRRRSATSELDKIAGLIYLSEVGSGNDDDDALLAYIVDDDPEGAWQRFMKSLPSYHRAPFFWLFPEPVAGERDRPAWCPSWEQVVSTPTLPTTTVDTPEGGFRDVEFDHQAYWIEYPRVECDITGLSELVAGRNREGDVMIQSTGESVHFRAVAHHNRPIPDGRYTLVTEDVGRPSTEGGNQSDEEGDEEAMAERTWLTEDPDLERRWAEGVKEAGRGKVEDGDTEDNQAGSDQDDEDPEDVEQMAGGMRRCLCVVGHAQLGVFKRVSILELWVDRGLWEKVPKEKGPINLA
ncbi:hypothetical protein FRB98_007643 [Tulasnella sp. 332]|nr:hypothetical protein FRB98_007643 [Tulasnella sp. 332]